MSWPTKGSGPRCATSSATCSASASRRASGSGSGALVVRTPDGNLLWDPPPFIDESAIAAVRERGGLAVVTSSHPHMYGAIVEWSQAFDAEILLPEVDVDAGWLMRPDPVVRTWAGSIEALPGVTLVQCGGHFPGSAVAHWRDALFVGDTRCS